MARRRCSRSFLDSAVWGAGWLSLVGVISCRWFTNSVLVMVGSMVSFSSFLGAFMCLWANYGVGRGLLLLWGWFMSLSESLVFPCPFALVSKRAGGSGLFGEGVSAVAGTDEVCRADVGRIVEGEPFTLE